MFSLVDTALRAMKHYCPTGAVVDVCVKTHPMYTKYTTVVKLPATVVQWEGDTCYLQLHPTIELYLKGWLRHWVVTYDNQDGAVLNGTDTHIDCEPYIRRYQIWECAQQHMLPELGDIVSKYAF
jgi:hypothetical protein